MTRFKGAPLRKVISMIKNGPLSAGLSFGGGLGEGEERTSHGGCMSKFEFEVVRSQTTLYFGCTVSIHDRACGEFCYCEERTRRGVPSINNFIFLSALPTMDYFFDSHSHITWLPRLSSGRTRTLDIWKHIPRSALRVESENKGTVNLFPRGFS